MQSQIYLIKGDAHRPTNGGASHRRRRLPPRKPRHEVSEANEWWGCGSPLNPFLGEEHMKVAIKSHNNLSVPSCRSCEVPPPSHHKIVGTRTRRNKQAHRQQEQHAATYMTARNFHLIVFWLCSTNRVIAANIHKNVGFCKKTPQKRHCSPYITTCCDWPCGEKAVILHR